MALILIIDDDTGPRTILRKILEKEGHEIVEANNGLKGLELYRSVPADLVIMDLLMPVKDGMETTLELTRQFPHAKVIAMTGAHGEQNFLDVAKLLGAHRTIEKPFEIEDLLRAVREELART
jgi:two-component system response regulator (stage 0 sporulation protein F)